MEFTVDPGSGAFIVKKTPEQKAIRELKLENQKLKEIIIALVQAQPESVKTQLPKGLLEKIID